MHLRLRPRVEPLEDRSTPATFTVTSLADAGAGTLRAAINSAEADAVADTIVFDPSVRGGTVNLTTFDTGLDPLEFGPSAFQITTPVTILGTGETIRRDPTAAPFRLFSVLTAGGNGYLAIADVELTGGLARGGNGFDGGGGAGGFGGAIYNAGDLTLRRVTVAGNTAQGGGGGDAPTTSNGGGGGGGGQSASGVNGGGPNGGTPSTSAGFGGGGVGAIATGAGSGGFGGGGGGVGATGFGAGGGFGGGGGGAPSGNNGVGGFGGGDGAGGAGGGGAGMGGGVFNNRGAVNVENSTVSGNAAVAGTGGTNTAQGLGGGVFNYNGTVVARSSTFTGNVANDGRQVFALGQFSGPANVASTDIGNSILGQPDVLVAEIVARAVSGGTSNTAGSGNLIRTNVGFLGGVVSTANPLLAPLANNGGPTRTHLPQAGSPALDALAASAAGTLTTDQRGVARVSGGRLDIGAVEVQVRVIVPPPPVVPVVPPPPVARVPSSYLVGVGPDVQVRAGDGTLLRTISAFAPTFTGGLSVAYADVTGDGVRDIIAGAGQFGGQIVKVFDGVSAALLYEFLAFDHALCGGVSVAAADLNGDGVAEIVVGAGAGGGPHVKVFDVSTGQLRLVKSFYAFSPEFRGGVNVGAGGGLLVVAAGPGGAPHVKAFRGLSDELVASFYAFAASFNGGVSATAGDLNGDGVPEIVAGAGQFGGSQVAVFDPAAGTVTASFRVYDPSFDGGVAVALEDVTADGALDFVFGAGPGGDSHVLVRNGLTFSLFSSYYAVGAGFRGGLKVA